MRKRAVLLVFLAAAAALDVHFYRGTALVAGAREESAPEARIAILERPGSRWTLNDELFGLLGKARFESGVDVLTDVGRRDADFRRALEAFLRSLVLNPLSAETHFDLAQALDYFRLAEMKIPLNPFQEYIQAARLAGQNPEILDRAGQVLLSKWSSLDLSEKRLTTDIVKSILAGGNEDKLLLILNTWALDVGDPAVVRAVLPADPAMERRYARFLAERSLDRNERIQALVRAETLEFARARAAAAAGRSDLQALKLKAAEAAFRAGLDNLRGIRFYQALGEIPTIDASEFTSLRWNLALGLAECRIETAKSLDEVLPDVEYYLGLEQNMAGVADLERALRGRRLIDDKLEAAGKDLRRLAFEMRLAYKQNRFREITEAAQTLERGILMVPEAAKTDYAAVLEIAGDAFQKLDYLYESNAFYQKARAAGGGGVDLLFKMKKNLERLSDAEGIRGVDVEIDKLYLGRLIDWTGVVVPKGTAFGQTLLLDGVETRLALRFGLDESALKPYVTILVNGRVAWENYLAGPEVVLTLNPLPGVNRLEIVPWNVPLALSRLEVRPTGEVPESLPSAGKAPSGKKAGRAAPLRSP